MNDDELKLKIKKDLANFPDSIIESWILEHYRRWPPDINSNCGPVFLFKSLDFWKNVNWENKEINISELDLSNSDEAINAIYSGFDFVLDDPKSIFEEIVGVRYIKILSYIFENGNFPAGVCLLKEGEKYSVADGHHRVYALCVAKNINNKLKNMDENYVIEFDLVLKEKWGVLSRKEVLEKQNIWIAKPI